MNKSDVCLNTLKGRFSFNIGSVYMDEKLLVENKKNMLNKIKLELSIKVQINDMIEILYLQEIYIKINKIELSLNEKNIKVKCLIVLG